MSVSENDVRHIAALARLGMSDDRVPALVKELNGILDHMDVLQRVDLSQYEAPTEVDGMPLRADVANAVQLSRPRERFAPSMQDGFFLVPKLDTHGAKPGQAEAEDES